MDLTEYDKAYYAGIFDGDGSVIIADAYGKYHHIRVIITNVFLPMLEIMQYQCGGNLKLDDREDGRLPDWSLTIIAQKDALQFLRDIYPYTCIKRDQVGLILDFIDGNNAMSWEELKLDLQRIKRIEYTDIEDGKEETSEIVHRMYPQRESGLAYSYIAGLVDTDGSINIEGDSKNKSSWTLNLSIGNSHLPTMKAIQLVLGSGRLRGSHTEGRMTWNVGLVARDAQTAIKQILPHLYVKRGRAHHALEFQAQKQSGRNQYTPQAEKDIAYAKQMRSQRLMKALQNIRFPDEEKALKYIELAPIY